MLGAVAVAVAAGMDLWAGLLHRFVWHGPLWSVHRTHHAPRRGRFERNDALSTLHAPIAIVLIVVGSRAPPSYAQDIAVGTGVGMTVFGALYLVLHDGLVHQRLPVRLLARVPWLRAIAEAHSEHHRRGGRGPYGILFGPWELAIHRSRADRRRAEAARRSRAPRVSSPPAAAPKPRGPSPT
jgi:beta-carotene 3-hydroxylase